MSIVSLSINAGDRPPAESVSEATALPYRRNRSRRRAAPRTIGIESLPNSAACRAKNAVSSCPASHARSIWLPTMEIDEACVDALARCPQAPTMASSAEDHAGKPCALVEGGAR